MRARSLNPFARIRVALDARPSPITVWWRDDDAVADTPALARLLALAAGTPLLLAAIPVGIEPSLARRLAGAANVRVAVHGRAHADHAPPGTKPAEFGPHRPLSELVADASEGLRLARARLAELPEGRLLPVFVPPWNRLDPALAAALPRLGYRGLSAVAGRPVPGLVRADIDLDPIDWRGTRSLIDPERLAEALAARIGAGGPVGLLTHHLAHDAALWTWLEDLLGLLTAHPAVTVADPRHLFAGGAVDGEAPPCSTARESARVS